MTSEPRVLTARAYRDSGGWWTIEIPELRSTAPNGVDLVATGGAVSTRGIPAAARELAAVFLDVGVDEVDVRVTIEAPAEILAKWNEGARAEEEARAALRHAGDLRREAVRALRGGGYTVEAAAAALHISPARVSQLASEAGSDGSLEYTKSA
ncbi:hypothetical protein GRS96_03915 [Rathayibacter sp. VKM Ac-2803]|uniref:hypothetical protein n=1 Tax=unclassified Rathayibacter TaxID=2609250 RepID=UPI0013570528|nr:MULTISPECIES: hypothetical protein [unclassified Rathayibacter]MWV48424.1 hypothetical protein [Rathayibacter sp. VKM Ac-2803]MWV59084.1 hypothetical protein [Rathayibacter sp. VKM Ac-2754]